MNNREAAYKHFMQEEMRIGKSYQDIFNAGYQAALAQANEVKQSQAQQEPAKAKHHPICDRRYPSLCDACNAEAKEESQAQQPKEAKPYGYAVEEADGEVKFFSTFDRPAESYAFKVNTRKIVPLYTSATQAQQESQWFLIETAPKNKKIIVTYKNALGKNRTVFAKYIEKFTEESTLDTECETDYCEDDDTFYLKEGWVELIDNWDEFSSVYFDSQNVPTHWMDIPPAPEGE